MDRKHGSVRLAGKTSIGYLRGRWIAAVASAALLYLSAAVAPAQTAATLVPIGVSLKAEDLQAAMTQAQQDTSLPGDVKAKVVDLYKQALDELHMADEWTAKGKLIRKRPTTRRVRWS